MLCFLYSYLAEKMSNEEVTYLNLIIIIYLRYVRVAFLDVLTHRIFTDSAC